MRSPCTSAKQRRFARRRSAPQAVFLDQRSNDRGAAVLPGQNPHFEALRAPWEGLGCPGRFSRHSSSRRRGDMCGYPPPRGRPARHVKFDGSVAIDTETMGLNPFRDALCVVQLSDGKGDAHVIRLKRPEYDCPNLKALVSNPKILKIFHFARFDLGMIQQWLGAPCFPVYCTKIASRLARTYTDRHSLKEIARELLGLDMSKAQQSSDWGADKALGSAARLRRLRRHSSP